MCSALVLLKLLKLKLLLYYVLHSSNFVEAVESVVVEAVDCCRLLCAQERSSLIEAYESVVAEDVVCCRLHYVL